MNKTQLIRLLSQKTNLSEKKCQKLMENFENILFDALSKGENISLRNVGTFYVKELGTRKIINPLTRRFYHLKSRKVARFKISGNLKNCIK